MTYFGEKYLLIEESDLVVDTLCVRFYDYIYSLLLLWSDGCKNSFKGWKILHSVPILSSIQWLPTDHYQSSTCTCLMAYHTSKSSAPFLLEARFCSFQPEYLIRACLVHLWTLRLDIKEALKSIIVTYLVSSSWVDTNMYVSYIYQYT